jgi:predicted permease
VEDLILVLALVSVPVLFIAWFVLWWIARRMIREDHQELWHELGEPAYLSPGTGTTFATFRFLFSGSLRRPTSRRLTTLRALMQVNVFLYLVAFSALVWAVLKE